MLMCADCKDAAEIKAMHRNETPTEQCMHNYDGDGKCAFCGYVRGSETYDELATLRAQVATLMDQREGLERKLADEFTLRVQRERTVATLTAELEKRDAQILHYHATYVDSVSKQLHDAQIATLTEQLREARETNRGLRGTATDLLRQRDAAQKDQIEIREALGCTEDDDDYIGALRKLARSNLDLRAARDAALAEAARLREELREVGRQRDSALAAILNPPKGEDQ